jgi:hypothetical protein
LDLKVAEGLFGFLIGWQHEFDSRTLTANGISNFKSPTEPSHDFKSYREAQTAARSLLWLGIGRLVSPIKTPDYQGPFRGGNAGPIIFDADLKSVFGLQRM